MNNKDESQELITDFSFLNHTLNHIDPQDANASQNAHNALISYLKEISKTPLLKPDEELKLAQAYS